MLDKIDVNILKLIMLISLGIVLFCLGSIAMAKESENSVFGSIMFIIMIISFAVFLICLLLVSCIILDKGIEEVYYLFPRNKLKRAIRGF